MARTLSAPAKRAIYAAQTGEVFAVLLELTHPQFSAPIRVNSSGEDLTIDGVTWQWFPFEFTLPDESDDTPPRVTLSVCAIDRSMIVAVRSISGEPIRVTMKIVLASSPTVVEAGPFSFVLRDVSYDAAVVSGTLVYEDILNEPYPGRAFTPSDFPGVF